MTFSVRTQVLGCLFRTMVARLSAGGLVKLDFQINRFFFFFKNKYVPKQYLGYTYSKV